MPPGTPFNSFILPYRIRVDNFASNTGDNAPALHLLTHTHSDHINGLSAQSFGYKVICSHDAKEMLLRHEVYGERQLHDQNYRAQKIRTFAHLRVGPKQAPDGTISYAGSRDLLETLPLHTPTKVELSEGESMTLTLLDANHCPGAVMFLIEGPQGAILHTGDFRAEPWFIESITRNPFLQPYLAPRTNSRGITKTLKAIYLDTASIMSRLSVPTKDRATSGLTELMHLFPETVYFFLNTWTWGYEDVLKAISREFNSPIHVDRYKYSVYQHISDPFLRSIVTQDPSSTRFHACERFNRCDFVAVDDDPENDEYNTMSHLGKRVVYVNPVNMGVQSWDLYINETKARLSRGEEVNNLLVPLSRHSPLDELRTFVRLFRPHRVIPNTLEPHLRGFDWAAIDGMFADCLHPDSSLAPTDIPSFELDLAGLATNDADKDVYMQNLIGEGAADVAERWAEKLHLRKKLDMLGEYLDPGVYDKMARIFGLPRKSTPAQASSPRIEVLSSRKRKGKERAVDSEDETDNGWSDDEQGRTAHRLFAPLAGIEGSKEHTWWVSSSPNGSLQDSSQADILEPVRLGSRKPISPEAQAGRPGPSAPWTSRLTPQSSPVRPKKRPPSIPIPPRNVTPRKQGLDANGPKDPLPYTPPQPSKRVSNNGNGHSLASPIVLSSSPLRPPLLFAQPPRPHSIRKAQASNSGPSTNGSKLMTSPVPSRVQAPKLSINKLPSALPSIHRAARPHLVKSNNQKRARESSPTPDVEDGRSSKAARVLRPFAKSKDSSATKQNSVQALTSSTSRLPPSSPPSLYSSPLIEGSNLNRAGPSPPTLDVDNIRSALKPTGVSRPSVKSKDRQMHKGENDDTLPGLSKSPGRRGARDKNKNSLQRVTSFHQQDPACSSAPASATEAVDKESYMKDSTAMTPPRQEQSESYIRRSRLRDERLLIAERLVEARPDLVDPSYAMKRTRLLARSVGSLSHPLQSFQSSGRNTSQKDKTNDDEMAQPVVAPRRNIESFETVDDDDGGMDWNRSKQLEEALREDVLNGRRPVLPALLCAESQDD